MKRLLILVFVWSVGSAPAHAVLVSDFTGVENITCQATAPAPPVGTSQGAFETNLAGHPHAYCMGVWAPSTNSEGRRSWTTWTLDQPYDFWHGGTNLQASFDMLSNQATSWATIKLYDGATLLAQKDCTPGASNVGAWVTYNFADILTSQCTHVTKIVWSSGYPANFYQHLDNFNANAVPSLPLDKGHRLLVEKGLQISGLLGNGPDATSFHLDRFRESNLTAIMCNIGGVQSALLGPPPGIPWVENNGPIDSAMLPYLPALVGYKWGEEQDLDDPAIRSDVVSSVIALRNQYPTAIIYTNQWGGQVSSDNVALYMAAAQPDMISFDHYDFGSYALTNPVGGSPNGLYTYLAKYRALGLAGNDGTGRTPIPYGTWVQTFRAINDPMGRWLRDPSDSEMRLNEFAAWTFGYTYISAYIYTADNWTGGYVPSSLFAGDGDTTPTSHFYELAETNRQSLNLGPSLVRLLSTGVRFIPGRHANAITNAIPAGVPAWAPGAGGTAFITGLSAVNLGDKNNGLNGDILIGFFKPLLESDDGPDFTNEVYFMITNGLSDGQGTTAETRQKITVTFDFGSSAINELQRRDRQTGAVEVVPLTALGGSQYRLELVLDGGTGDLFKFNTGAHFVGDSSAAALRGQVVLPGYLGDPGIVGVRVELYRNGDAVQTFKTVLSDNGAFTVTGIKAGVYDVAVRASNYLGTLVPDVTVDGNPTDMGTIILQAGDVNGDNAVTFEDFSILQNSYGRNGSAAADLGISKADPAGVCTALGLLLAALAGTAFRTTPLGREQNA